MKDQLQEYMSLVKGFMKKHYLLFLSLKVLKILIVVLMFSCESKTERPSNVPDTIMVDSIEGNAPGDSILYKNEEEEEDSEEDDGNPMVPQEG